MEKTGKKFNKLLLQDQDHKLDHMHKNSLINYKNNQLIRKIKKKQILNFNKYLSSVKVKCKIKMFHLRKIMILLKV
jgi:hypothetical protein